MTQQDDAFTRGELSGIQRAAKAARDATLPANLAWTGGT